MRAVTWILCCLSLIFLSECSQIVLSNDVENTNTPNCQIGSMRRVFIMDGRERMLMGAESKLHNYKLGRGSYYVKFLKVDVIVTNCYGNYCKALWKQIPESGGYYLYMAKNGYIYETSSETSSDRYFVYSYNAKAGKCVWRSRIKGSYLTRDGGDSEKFFVVGGSDGHVFDFKFQEYDQM